MKFLKLSLAIAVFCLFISTHQAMASSVTDQVKTTIDKILEILRDPSLKGDESVDKRRELLRVTINEKFSFAKMSQLSLGKHWKERSDDEKKQFTKLFGQLLEDTYISKIEGYTDEKIVYTKELVKKKKAQVNTKIVTDSVEIPLDYRLYKLKDDSWMVYDMVIEGVSLIGNYRSQFDQILKKNSFDTLVEELKKKMNK